MNIQEIRAQIVQQLIQSYGDRYSPSVILDEAEKLVKYIQNGAPKKEEAPKADEPTQASQWSQILKDIQDKQAKDPPQIFPSPYISPWADPCRWPNTPYYTLSAYANDLIQN